MTKWIDVTAALIWDEDRLLIARRNRGPQAGLWEFPGGKVEDGETLVDCLIREIQEELGLEIALDRPLLTVEHHYPEFSIRLHGFCCRRLSGELGNFKDHDQVEWVTIAELSDYSFAPADIPLVETLQTGGPLRKRTTKRTESDGPHSPAR